MSKVRTIEIHENIFANNLNEAQNIRENLNKSNTLLINVMSSPGSGKTTTISKVINQLKSKYKIAVLDVDIESDLDAQTIADNTGVDSIQINNGGLCHIDADMTARALTSMDTSTYDIIFLENIGNLVCPAEFDTGAHINIMLLSVPEGDDKPLKYPLMFSKVDLVVITKIDTLKVFDFDMKKCENNIRDINPDVEIMSVRAKTGEGILELAQWIINQKSKRR